MSGKIFQYFLILVALLTLNSSVDIPDYLLYENTSERDNSNFNEIESAAELVCEYALNIHGQFPDKKSDSASHHHAKKLSTIKFNDKHFAFSFRGFRLAEQNLPVFQPVYFTDFTKEILSPPPQA